jgi:phosphoserine aminotransferase
MVQEHINACPTPPPFYRPFFSSGPTVGFKDLPPFTPALQGRSHRSKEALALIENVKEFLFHLLDIPKDYAITFINGSATAAVETAMWNLLGAHCIDFFAQDVFGHRWALEGEKIFQSTHIHSSNPGALPLLDSRKKENDAVFVWNGTTTGVTLPDGPWLQRHEDRLNICDATSAAFGMPLPFHRLDATAFSFQKALGGEAGLGVLVLSPRAIKRLETFLPPHPIPYLYRLRDENNKPLSSLLFEGKLNNTPSLYTLEQAYHILNYVIQKGGLSYLIQKAKENTHVLEQFLVSSEPNGWSFLAKDSRYRSALSPCLLHPNLATWEEVHVLKSTLESQSIAYDIANHQGCGVPSLRLWCGPTVEGEDIQFISKYLNYQMR